MRHHFPLSQREREIIDLAAEGCTDSEIANRLGIRRPTVGTYWNRIRIKVGGGGRTELVAHVLHADSDAELASVRADYEARLEVALHDQDLCHELMENAPDAILVISDNGDIYRANHAAAKLFGYGESEINGLPLARLIPEPFRKDHNRKFLEYLKHPGTEALCFRNPVMAVRSDGTAVGISPDISAFTTHEGRFLACVIRAVSEQGSFDKTGTLAALREEPVLLTGESFENSSVSHLKPG